MIDTQMTTARLAEAKTHVYNVCQQGADITLIKAGTKDEFGEILTESTQALKAHPVRTTPFDRNVSDKITWSENVDVIFYVSKKAIDDLSLTIVNLKQYEKVRYNTREYELRYVDYYSSFGTDCLYMIIGAKI